MTRLPTPGGAFNDFNYAEVMMAAECYRFANWIGAAVVDIWALAGRSTEPWNTNGYQTYNNFHPSATGHQQYYNAIQPIVIAS